MERNPQARKHPWLIALGILASVAVTLAIVAGLLLFIAFRDFVATF